MITKDDEATLKITLRDINDDPLSKINLSVKIIPLVKINSKGEESEDLPNEFSEVSSGVYEVSFKPKQFGDHMISILVNGNHILDSPYK